MPRRNHSTAFTFSGGRPAANLSERRAGTDREYSGAQIGHFRAFAIMGLKAPVHGLLSIMFGVTDNSSRVNAKTEEDLANGASGIANSMCGGQWEGRISEDLIKLESEEDERRKTALDDDDEEHLAFEPAGNFMSVGRDPIRKLHLGYTRDSFIRLLPGPRLLDIDDSTFLFLINRSLAERVKAIHMYANDYKLIEIARGRLSHSLHIGRVARTDVFQHPRTRGPVGDAGPENRFGLSNPVFRANAEALPSCPGGARPQSVIYSAAGKITAVA